MDWRHKAVCRDEDPELFFPVGNSGPALAQIADAKLVCNRCSVVTECLTWALDSGQDAGVWGPGDCCAYCEIYKTIVCMLSQLILRDGGGRENIQRHFHVFKTIHWCAEIEVFDV